MHGQWSHIVVHIKNKQFGASCYLFHCLMQHVHQAGHGIYLPFHVLCPTWFEISHLTKFTKSLLDRLHHEWYQIRQWTMVTCA